MSDNADFSDDLMGGDAHVVDGDVFYRGASMVHALHRAQVYGHPLQVSLCTAMVSLNGGPEEKRLVVAVQSPGGTGVIPIACVFAAEDTYGRPMARIIPDAKYNPDDTAEQMNSHPARAVVFSSLGGIINTEEDFPEVHDFKLTPEQVLEAQQKRGLMRELRIMFGDQVPVPHSVRVVDHPDTKEEDGDWF